MCTSKWLLCDIFLFSLRFDFNATTTTTTNTEFELSNGSSESKKKKGKKIGKLFKYILFDSFVMRCLIANETVKKKIFEMNLG